MADNPSLLKAKQGDNTCFHLQSSMLCGIEPALITTADAGIRQGLNSMYKLSQVQQHLLR